MPGLEGFHCTRLPCNEHVDNGIDDQHKEHVSKVKVVVQGDVLRKVSPLDPLPSYLQERYGVDSETHARVGQNAERYLSTTVEREKHTVQTLARRGCNEG